MDSHNVLCLAGLLNSSTELLQWLLEKQPIGFLPASCTLWQLLASLMPLYDVLLTADAAATASSPHAAGLPFILCELAASNQQFLALLTTQRQPHWPAAYQKNVPGFMNVLLLLQEVAFRLSVTLIDRQQEKAQAAAAAAAGGAGGMFGSDGQEQQQQGQALPGEGLSTSGAVMQLAASPALWAAAWAQLAAFCQGMYTWQGGSNTAGSSGIAGIFASPSPDHEQVAAVFSPREISARIEVLAIPAKGRPFSETALASTIRRGFAAPAAFLDILITFHGRSVLCEGPKPEEGASEGEGRENSGARGSSSGRDDSSSRGNNGRGGGGSSGVTGGGGSSSANAGAGEDISRTSTGSSCGEASSGSSSRTWSGSRGGVAPAAALQLILEAAALLGVAERHRESSAAVILLCTMAKNCSLGPRKCLLSTRGGLVLDVVTAAARYHPESFIDIARNFINIFLGGAEEGGWVSGWNQ